MNMDGFRKNVIAGGAAMDQISAFLRESVESMPLEVLKPAWHETYVRTRLSMRVAREGRGDETERCRNLMDALRNIAYTLVLAGEIERRGREKIAAAEGDAQ